MLTLTRKADYALVAMADLARQDSAVVSTRDMASRLRMPLPVLQIIMTELARQGLVTSTRGPRGGFRLSRPATRITVAQIIEAVEGPFRLAICCRPELGGREAECDIEDVCPIRDSVRKVHALVESCLSGVTLTELVYDQVQAPLGWPQTWRGLRAD
ncbi:MAG: Rrf2 family transcriptional regulator [Planctomycetes bacterium]|nr:Rrf2 family transcriptional regulator [Planctomycetota bacterium]